MDTALFIGYSASICSVASFVPQAWKIYQSGQTAAISAPMYVLTVGGFALWTWFGFLRGELPIILTNAVCLILSGSILMMKLRRRFRPPVDTTKP
ncbi:SemiSWEET transporter [Rhizobium sp. TRM96647]|uniref:SemiSWEET family sugar transporter n=1 Tax=unclassified Rhizobium TaxID=2613769 RepID=UPI0021E89662|nr:MULTISPECIES: SemiSWEET transporter [unclassified Rhizobium]MCV3739319.1 SemiSWEET transporter [Rhizobium sp. TRM96647]MCV3760931.1 SemiSWEET transporter [Rhizobium sp. TRM96650]